MLSILHAIMLISICLLVLFTIAIEVVPTAVARLVDVLPGGSRLTRPCSRCLAPVLRGRGEHMPVAFTDDDGAVASETLAFCTACSREMTLEDRLDRLHELREEDSDREVNDAEV